MNIVALSDTHSLHDNVHIPDGDVLIFAGDAELKNERTFRKWIGWFRSHPHPYKIFIAGNHDEFLTYDTSYGILNECGVIDTRQLSTPFYNLKSGDCVYLENSGCSIEGRTIFGSPYVSNDSKGSFMLNKTDLERAFSKIPNHLDILVTHSPPKYILDVNETGQHRGNKYLFRKISERIFDIGLYIFGHIHYPERNIENFYNVSVVNNDYELTKEPVQIKFSKGSTISYI